MGANRTDENPLTVVIIDVSPVAWGDRDLRRTASDKQRQAQGKSSVGPLILEELLAAVQAFASAFMSLNRDSALVLVGVAGNEVAVLYPRKDHLEEFFSASEMKLDSTKIQHNLVQGVSELVTLAANQVGDSSKSTSASLAAMASAFSVSLSLINRFLVASNSGVSALRADHSWNRGNADDEGVIAAIGGGGGKKKIGRKTRAWSPRVLMIQASDDRAGDYNAIMNCAFAAVKHQVVVDGCFLRCDGRNTTSAFLEQTCDLTGGLFLPLHVAAQANKALTEVLLSVFLPPRSCRGRLNLPAINEVDFRARSFDTSKSVNMAFVCNQCLSIFEDKPSGRCPTCDAEIRSKKLRT